DTVTVNQQNDPVGVASGGVVYQKLGKYSFNSGSMVVVLSTTDASGTLVADAVGEVAARTAGGGGISPDEAQPAYQSGGGTQSTTQRTTPDVAMDAATGVAVYDSYNNGPTSPWRSVGGTSLSAPMWAGLIAIANQGRAHFHLQPLDGPSETLPRIYALPSYD